MAEHLLLYPFHKQCQIEIPLEWSVAPLIQVCTNPDLRADYLWQEERWIYPNYVTWDPVRCVLTLTFATPQSGTVVLQEEQQCRTAVYPSSSA